MHMPVTDIVELPQEEFGSPVEIPKPQRSVYLATPCYGCQVTNSYAASLIALQALCVKKGVPLQVDFIGNESLVERARNVLVERYLKYSDYSHFLFIDADIGFDPNSVFRLLDFDQDVVSAVYPKKSIDWAKVKEKLRDGDPEDVRQMGLDFNINVQGDTEIVDGFVRVLDTATGFLMIKRRVLERMREAYRGELFAVNDIMGQNIDNYVAMFACMIDPDTKRFLSEDYSFCRRYQQIGGEIWADLLTPLSHTGTNMFRGDVRERFVAST